MSASGEQFPMHKAVFEDDIRALKSCLNKTGVNVEDRDVHSLTPLLLAAKLGRKDCAELLVKYGGTVDAKSDDGWTVLDEAVVYGDRDLIEFLVQAAYTQANQELHDLKPKLQEALSKLSDFTLVFQWELHSWIPLSSRLLPSDVCRLHKRGSRLRMDATLQSITDLMHRRGNLSYFLDCTNIAEVIVVDHNRRIKEVLQPQISSKFVQESTSMRLSKEVVHSFISTQPIHLTRCRSGWLWRADKDEQVAGYTCPVYDITGVTLTQRRRTEHLSDRDVQRLQSIRRKIRGAGEDGGDIVVEDSDDEASNVSADEQAEGVPFRPSLPAPTSTATWADYINSSSGGLPDGIGRIPKMSEDRRQFKPTVSLSDDFPIPRDVLMEILELIAPYKHFNKLRQLVSRLPTGFPLKVEIPLYPTISAKLAFQEFREEEHSDSLFVAPRYEAGHVFRQRQA